ncbi:MAG: GNAT family N-acetyltransferase [Bdellovibrionales bacterium]
MGATVAAKKILRTLQEVSRKKSLLQRIREYRPYIHFEQESADFLVTTASGGHQLFKALELRHEVFIKDWQGRTTFHRLDVDDYDFNADHLLILDKEHGDVVGTYRLLSSHFTHDFYSAQEFTMNEFLRIPAVKLEMGRACIHPDYRDGRTIDVLWSGLSKYIELSGTDYLFGCSSIKSVDPIHMSKLYRTLQDQGSWENPHSIQTTSDFFMPGFTHDAPEGLTPTEKRELLPPLLRSYLHAGAKVHGVPAWDRDFNCTDLMTILEWKNLNKRFQSRFMGG